MAWSGLLFAAVLMSALFVFFFFAHSTPGNLNRSSTVLAATLNEPSASAATDNANLANANSAPISAENAVDHSAENNAELQALIEKWVKSNSNYSQWGIAVQGLKNTSIEASIQGETIFESASIYKLYVIYALSQKVPESQWVQTLPGDYRTIGQCVDAMLIRSDNACGVALGNWLGWSKAQKIINDAGYSHTILNLSPVRTTVSDTLNFMSDLYKGKTFSAELRQSLINDMQKSVYRKGIVAGCPGCKVANKTGQANGYNHDAAIVTVGGKTFALSIFTNGGSTRQIAEITQKIQKYISSL